MKKIQSIGVITTGGDAPGMNAAIRAVVRTAINNNLRVFGIHHGWHGLIENQIEEMGLKSVGGIINRGGTILHTTRCPGFKQKSLRKKAFQNLAYAGIEGLVVIGGDGSIRATNALYKEFHLPTVNIPASIDNDIYGTDYTIGFDTAVNTAVGAIDKIRDTATSHDRLFVIEVMGRDSGSIAIDVALVCGAEAVLIPEKEFNLETIIKNLEAGKKRGKSSSIIIVAEGAAKAVDIGKALEKRTCFDVRVSVLGHMQRGGTPSALSREIACKLANQAVELLLQGKYGYVVGIRSEEVSETPIATVIKRKKQFDLKSYKLIQVLSK